MESREREPRQGCIIRINVWRAEGRGRIITVYIYIYIISYTIIIIIIILSRPYTPFCGGSGDGRSYTYIFIYLYIRTWGRVGEGSMWFLRRTARQRVYYGLTTVSWRACVCVYTIFVWLKTLRTLLASVSREREGVKIESLNCDLRSINDQQYCRCTWIFYF